MSPNRGKNRAAISIKSPTGNMAVVPLTRQHPLEWRTAVRDGVGRLIDIEKNAFELVAQYGLNLVYRLSYILPGKPAAAKKQGAQPGAERRSHNPKASVRQKIVWKAA